MNRAFLVSALVAALLVSGCSNPDRPDPDLTATANLPSRPLTPEENYVVQAARDRLIASCMAEAGFTWEVHTSRNQPADPNPYPTVEELRRSGYGVDFEVEFNSHRDSNERALYNPTKSMSEEEQQAFADAFHGTGSEDLTEGGQSMTISTGGCNSEATEAIFGSEENLAWLSRITEVASHSQLADGLMDVFGYEIALRDWQGCMRDRGVTWMDGEGFWTDWDSGWSVLRTKMYTDDVQLPQQVIDEVISADADCLESTDLYQVRQASLEPVRAGLWKRAGTTEAEKWRMQQLTLVNAKKVP